jgi:hypothetical protein
MSKVKLLFLLLLPAFAFGGCIVGEGDERCDNNQYFSDFACHCVKGTVPAPDGFGCEKCGKHQVVKSDKCVCAEGFKQMTTDGPCVEAPEGLGADCTPGGSVPCPEDFPICQLRPSGAGFCTKECAGDSDCATGYRCTPVEGEKKVCTPPPTGDAVKCTGPADCAAFDANYCSMIQMCVVKGCSAEAPCWADGANCCDYSSVGGSTVCMSPASIAAMPTDIPIDTSGSCPLGGVLVGGAQ